MDMRDLGSLLEKMHIKRDRIFISISSKNKKVARRLVELIDKRLKLPYWCMYDQYGNSRNITGMEYPKVIAENLARCCVFIFLMSRESLASPEVRAELVTINREMEAERLRGELLPDTEEKIQIMPIFVDDTTEIPEEVVHLTGISDKMINSRFNAETSELDMLSICDEIRDQYTMAVMANVRASFVRQKNAQKFNELMSACVRSNRCTTRTVSDDIKASNEIASDSLKEMHVLSNELLEYDCNTYSCMIIASNLLGNEVTRGGRRTYDPSRKGVRYYYYTPKNAVAEKACDAMFEKLKSFIARDEKSRKEVTALIRSEFCSRNKIETFFSTMNGLTVDDFAEQYHIVRDADKEAFYRLFGEDDVQAYFAYDDEGEVFKIPDEFIAWTEGDDVRFSYDTMLEEAYKFIDFIGAFVALLDRADDINSVSAEALKKRHKHLTYLRTLEEWQMERITISSAQSKKLINFLLDYTIDAKNNGRKFPRLANWMQFYRDDKGKNTNISDAVLESAYSNLIRVPVEDDEALKLCYSFALFVGEGDDISGAWYSTGQSGEDAGDDMLRHEGVVTTFDITREDAVIYEDMISAFEYLVRINESAQEVLTETKSVFGKKTIKK